MSAFLSKKEVEETDFAETVQYEVISDNEGTTPVTVATSSICASAMVARLRRSIQLVGKW